MIFKLISFFSILFCLNSTQAGELDSGFLYSIGVISGPFLPSKIPDATEILEVGGLRFSGKLRFGIFEAEAWSANGDGEHYKSLALNYRVNVSNDIIPAHALLGVHADSWKSDSVGVSRSSGGWQMGGGSEFKIVPGFALRTDFEYRFGPGTSLLVTVSFLIGVGDKGSSSN